MAERARGSQYLEARIGALPARQGPQVDLRDLYAESGQTLQGSFSSVSKPNFARKYALESS